MRLIDKLPLVVLLLSSACGEDLPGLPPLRRRDAGAEGGQPGDDPASQQDGGAQQGDGDGGDTGPVEPTPTGSWRSASGDLKETLNKCGVTGAIVTKPDEDKLIVHVTNKALYQSTNGGQTWTVLGDGAGSVPVANRGTGIVFDPDDTNRYWQTGIYEAQGIYRTLDNGKTFAAMGGIIHIDSLVVNFADPERKLMIAGGHEQARTVYRSEDSGATFRPIGEGLPAEKICTFPLIINPTTYLVGCSHFTTGIYRTTDSGVTWTSVSDIGGSGAPLRTEDGVLYWGMLDGNGLVRSTNDGVSWEQIPNLRIGSGGISPIELPDGKIAIVGEAAVLVSSNGTKWSPASTALPFDARYITGFAYSTHQKAFFIKHFKCDTDDSMTDAILRFDYPK